MIHRLQPKPLRKHNTTLWRAKGLKKVGSSGLGLAGEGEGEDEQDEEEPRGGVAGADFAEGEDESGQCVEKIEKDGDGAAA